MQITDLYGKPITVTDLNKAIEQAAAFKEMQHEDSSHQAADNERKAYWTDVWQQLVNIKNQSNGNNEHHS